jgi:uncharacterized protein with gpF-like domain
VKRKGEKILKPVHPNSGIAAAYRAKLEAIVEAMQRSYVYFIKAQYRETPPRMAQDETPAKALEREMSQLGKRWQSRIDEAAPKLARWFAKSTSAMSSASLKKILKDAGMTVEFKMTPAMRDVFDATVAEQVGLIKSIASQYHSEVQGMVQRSVAAGRDLGTLAKDLEQRYGITKRRAAFISLDQNNKSTAVFTRVRQQEAGIEKAIWLHSHAGKAPRVTHLANSGKPYDIATGWFDPDPKVNRFIFPGQLPRCRCTSKSIVKGFS